MELCFKIAKRGKATAIRRETGDKRGKPTWDQLKEKDALELNILGVPYGGHLEGRDEDGEAFYAKTDIVLNPGDVIPLTYYHGFGPDDPFEEQNPPEIIGLAKYLKETDTGHKFLALVDPEKELGARIAVAINDKADVKASSGAVAHLTRRGKGGLIDYWPVAEMAIFDTNEWRMPANQLATVEKTGAKSPPCRQSGETQDACVSRKVPEITRENPDWDQERVVAAAFSMCRNACNEARAKNEALSEAIEVANQESNEADCLEDQKTKNSKNKKSEEMDEKEKKVEKGQEEVPSQPLFDADTFKAEIADLVKDQLTEAIKALTPNAPAAVAQGVPAYVKAENLGSEPDKYGLARYVKTGFVPKSQKAALQEGTTTEGGYLVPDDELREIIRKRDEVSIVRQMGARTFTTNRDVFNVPVEDASLTKFSIVAEEGDVTAAEEEPTFGQVVITIYKMMKLMKVSEELLEDDNAGLEAFLADCIGRAWADTENYYALIGTGTGQPQGAFVGGTAALTLDSATAIGAAEIPELKYKLAQPYRAGGTSWVMNQTTEAYLRGLSGDPFTFAPNPRGTGNAWLETLVGFPVFNNSNVAEIGTTNKTLLFANWNYYALVTNRTLRIRRLMELYAETGQIGILASVRFGGAVLLADAFQYATHP